MQKLKNLKVGFLSLILFAWFFGIGSWSNFFGFMTYGLLPGSGPAMYSYIKSEQSSGNPKVKEDKNQIRQKQALSISVNTKNDWNVDHIESYRPY
jgi:hypothetical protein